MRDEMLVNDEHLNASDIRQFLQHPMGGASAQQLRRALQTYSSTNSVHGLIETVRAFYQHQGASSSDESGDESSVSRIIREDLKLVCYENIYAQTFSGDNGQVQATDYHRENGSGSISGLLTHYQSS
jgi:hypothetical protein